MKAAVWSSEKFGLVLVALAPKEPGPPRTAVVPGKVPAGIVRHLAEKGSSLTWEQWFEHLAEGLPIDGRWTVEEVPDRLTPRQALTLVQNRRAGNLT